MPNHKEHIAIDTDSELITAVAVTPGNVADSEIFSRLVDSEAQEVTADKGYDTNANHQKLKDRGQRSSIILKKNRTSSEIVGQADSHSQRERPNIERKFAEQGTPLKLRPPSEGGKSYHGLSQARYWGLVKVTIQALLTCIVVNCKSPTRQSRFGEGARLVRLLEAGCGPPGAAVCPAGGRGR